MIGLTRVPGLEEASSSPVIQKETTHIHRTGSACNKSPKSTPNYPKFMCLLGKPWNLLLTNLRLRYYNLKCREAAGISCLSHFHVQESNKKPHRSFFSSGKKPNPQTMNHSQILVEVGGSNHQVYYWVYHIAAFTTSAIMTMPFRLFFFWQWP